MTTENIVSRGFTQVEFVDQYGDTRTIYRQSGNALRVKKKSDTVSHVLNRVAAEVMGDRIKARRIAAGLTLDGLLQKAGLAAGAGQGKARMYEIETASRHRNGTGRQAQGVRFGTLYALAIALECEVSDLLPSAREVAERAGVALIVPNAVRLSAAA
jgi:transcriptional regulator with XRE-family HTH domain